MSVTILDENNFEKEILQADKTCLVDFFATWCGPCKMMAPVIDEIASENPDVKVAKLDVDEADEIAEQYGVMSIPTLIVFKNGEAVKTFVGVQPKEDILAALK